MILSSIGIIASKSGFDADAQAFITAASITDTIQKNAINTMVVSLKSNSLWDKFIAIYPMVGGTQTTHTYNLKSRSYDISSWNGSWSHSSSGATPTVNSYADTGVSPSNAFLGQDDASAWYYATGNYNTSPSIQALVSTTNFTLTSPQGSANYSRLNCAPAPSSIVDNNFRKGFLGMSRVSSTDSKYFVNNTLLFTKSDTSTTPSSSNLVIGSNTGFGTVLTCGFTAIGKGFSLSEESTLYSIILTYQTSLNRN
jgi:hypothetical protein